MKKILASSISGWAVLGLISITLTQATPANTARLSYTYGLGVEGGFTTPDSHSEPCVRLSTHTAPSVVDCCHQNIRFLLSCKTQLNDF